MISEELDLYSLVKESLERDIRNQEEKNIIFKSYLKKDRYDNLSLVCYGWKECSVHCIFNDTKLKEYFSSLNSVKSFAALNGTLF
jgi:hypothetical protein